MNALRTHPPLWIGDLDSDEKDAALRLNLKLMDQLQGENMLIGMNAVMLVCVAMIHNSRATLGPDAVMEGLTHSALTSYSNMKAFLSQQETP